VPAGLVRYRSVDEDSDRWRGFPFRPDDIVISTRSKSGTTWMQMICALLVFQSPDLPAPVSELSPWLDWLIAPRTEVFARLAGQEHRRFIKTHTPLDGVPFDSRVTYVVVARHPLDMAVSLYFQGLNLDRSRMSQLSGRHAPAPAPSRAPLRQWLLSWIGDDVGPREQLDSLRGVLWHYADAWERRQCPNVVLVHYGELTLDLDGAMRRLADRLGIAGNDEVWADLVKAATFEQMRARPERVAPVTSGVLKDPLAFFRRGSSGAGREVLTDDELSHYHARVAALAPSEVLEWLHHDERPPGPLGET
jgi:aryl sulfotransferase